MANSKSKTGKGTASRAGTARKPERGFLMQTMSAGRNQLKSTLGSVGKTMKKMRQKLLKK